MCSKPTRKRGKLEQRIKGTTMTVEVRAALCTQRDILGLFRRAGIERTRNARLAVVSSLDINYVVRIQRIFYLIDNAKFLNMIHDAD